MGATYISSLATGMPFLRSHAALHSAAALEGITQKLFSGLTKFLLLDQNPQIFQP